MQLGINSLVEFLYAMLSPAMESFLLEVLGKWISAEGSWVVRNSFVAQSQPYPQLTLQPPHHQSYFCAFR